MAKLEVISSTLVPMATDTSPISRLDLTPWDLQLLLLEPIQKGILFQNPLDKPANLIDRLKNTLSRVLDYFPPLAGRLATDNIDKNNNYNYEIVYFVNCNNQGAGFIHAAAPSMSVSDILEAKHTPEIVYSFFPLNGARNFHGTSDPLFEVQVTELKDGLFVGCTANHAVVDGTSFWHLVNSWSEISRRFGEISRMPFFGRNFTGREWCVVPVPTIDGDKIPKLIRPPLLEGVFHVSKENMARLKVRANSEAAAGGGINVEISSFQALLAHVWRCVTRCRRKRNPMTSGEDVVYLYMAIGARGRVPLPEGYFGNAHSVSVLGLREADMLGDGLGQIGVKINRFVAQRGTAGAVWGFLEDWAQNPTPLTVTGSSNFLVSSSPRFNVYGCDFGWGRPVAVRSGMGQKRDGKITVYPAAEAGGVDVEVCLAAETLKVLEDDDQFIEFTGKNY